MIKQIVLIIEAYYCPNYVQKFIKHPAVKVNSIRRGNYWGSQVLILTQVNYYHIFYIHQILEKKWEYNEALCQLLYTEQS